MKTGVKATTIRDIENCYNKIAQSEKFHAALMTHVDMICKEFASNKMFYKFIFKNNRFLASIILTCVYFKKESPCLNDIKTQCVRTNMISPNTVSSLLLLLKAGNYISTRKDTSDKRKTHFSITDKGLKSVLALTKTIAVPLDEMGIVEFKINNFTKKNAQSFFERYFDIFYHDIHLVNIAEKADIFVNKDSGHMIMSYLYLYGLTAKNSDEALTIISLAKRCGVSRSHLRNIIFEAKEKALVDYDPASGHIEILASYNAMYRKYMAYYFSFVLYAAGNFKNQDSPLSHSRMTLSTQ